MILAIRTDTPVLQLWLYSHDLALQADNSVELGRTMARDILMHIETLLGGHGGWPQLSGLVVFTGPGSFTGLRIGATVANAVAYARGVPVVGVNGDDWLQNGLTRLRSGINDKVVLPHYGRPANITIPRK